jgi:hypothetical protein
MRFTRERDIEQDVGVDKSFQGARYFFFNAS